MPPDRTLFYAATAGAIALAIKSVVLAPPPAWVAGTALFFYVGLVVLGAVFSRFSMYANVVTLGPRHARGVALTFDDGPCFVRVDTCLGAGSRQDQRDAHEA